MTPAYSRQACHLQRTLTNMLVVSQPFLATLIASEIHVCFPGGIEVVTAKAARGRLRATGFLAGPAARSAPTGADSASGVVPTGASAANLAAAGGGESNRV